MLWTLMVRYARPSWLLLVGIIIFQFVQSLLSLTLPTINADIIDDGVLQGDTDTVWRLGFGMLGLSLGQVVANVLAILLAARLAMKAGHDLRADVFGRVGDFSEQDVQRFGAASLITRTTNDVQQVQMLMLMTCSMLIAAPLLAIGGIVMALRADPTMSWLIAASVPLMLGAMLLIVGRLVPIFRLLQERTDRVNQVMREQLTGIRVVRAFVRERREKERFDDANEGLYDAMLRAGRLFVLLFPLITLILNVSTIAVIWFGGQLVDSGELEVGTMMAFLQYLMQILIGVMMASFMAMMIPRAAVSAKRIAEVLGTTPSIDREKGTAAPAAPGSADYGTVEFDNVTFAYPGAEEPVLRGVSFRAEPGQTVAIIGATGAGKTTIVNLLARLFDVTSGAVRVGGVDVREAQAESLWQQVGLVPQRPYLFGGTVASNLRYGDPDASDEQLWAALETAQAADFVREREGGLDSGVAQGGTDVSGGQRQRLSIARALVKKPPILVFDDSFSALDLTTDARLRAALERDAAGATRIVVAQRVSTIVDADRIVVLEDGAIAGIGTHSELLGSNDIYREIADSQMAVEV